MKFQFLIYAVFLIGMLITSVLYSKNGTVKVVHPFAIEIAANIMATITSAGMVMPNIDYVTEADGRVFNTLTQTTITHVNKKATCRNGYGGDFKTHILKKERFLNLCLLFVNENLRIPVLYHEVKIIKLDNLS